MSKKDIASFYAYLVSTIIDLYHTDEKCAYKAISLANMDAVIEKFGKYVNHDPIEVWAESVWQCYLRRTAYNIFIII